MSVLHLMQPSLTDEGLCRACDEAQWFEGRRHNCLDAQACACLVCHPAPLTQARAVFDALDAVLAINIPRPRRQQRRNRIAALA